MEKKKVGRPKFQINYNQVEKLANIMCTIDEIAAVLGCNRDTLYVDEKFSDIYKKGLDKGKMSLRRNQYRMSETNPTMAIWLGKQYLKQSDTINADIEEINNAKEILVKIRKMADSDERKDN
jgi:hypothetical protein